MKKLFLIPFVLVFIVSCGDSQTDSNTKDNADAAENFIYLVLNEPDEAKNSCMKTSLLDLWEKFLFMLKEAQL